MPLFIFLIVLCELTLGTEKRERYRLMCRTAPHITEMTLSAANRNKIHTNDVPCQMLHGICANSVKNFNQLGPDCPFLARKTLSFKYI